MDQRGHGGWIYSKIVWMVCVKLFPKHASCCMVSTYQGRGTTKPGLRPSDHAILYNSTKEPVLVAGENVLKSYPVKLHDFDHTIHEACRIDFSRVQTVDDYVQTFIIGTIETPWLQDLLDQFINIQTAALVYETNNTALVIHTEFPEPNSVATVCIWLDIRNVGTYYRRDYASI